MIPRWETRHTALIHRAGIFDVEQLARVHPETGEAHAVCRISSPDWANIVALTADDQVVLVNQYRHGIDAASLEIPGGIVDPGEDPLAGAKRELLEETGYGGGQWELLGRVSANPAFMTNSCSMYLATGVELLGPPTPDLGEVLEVVVLPLEEVIAMTLRGEIHHAIVVAAMFHIVVRNKEGT